MTDLIQYFKGDELASSVWKGKYAQEGEETPDDEAWKPILNFEDKYLISNYGRVFSIGTLHKKDKRGRYGKRKPMILKNQLNLNTYLVTIKNKFVHRLVGQHFIQNPNDLDEINHKDGNKLNNYYTNLEWCTRSHNAKHAYDTGLNKGATGEKSGNCKLKEHDVSDIRKLYQTTNFTQEQIGNLYNISKQQVHRIINKTRWKHLD